MLMLTVGGTSFADDPALTASRALLERVAPGRGGEFVVEIVPPAEGGRDVYELAVREGRPVLRGNSAVSVASALNRYLADGGWGSFSRCGDRLALPKPAPPPAQTVRVVSPFTFRYAYNFCTLSYTFAWADEEGWARELDQLALHGCNAALVIAGVEQSWVDTLTRFGYSDEEARDWLVWPSHQAWQQMSNLERFGGRPPASVVAQRLRLGQFIVRRMRELGMQPVLPGYYGIVPTDFGARHPEAKVHDQGGWAGGFHRPAMLDPLDPLYAKVADAFFAAQQRRFGATRFWAADPFHEGGQTAGMDMAAAGRAMAAAMARANPDYVWVMQAWGGNPRRAIVEALDRDRVLVLDLGCERVENWRSTGAFYGAPWAWSVIMNFGGNSGFDCRIEALAVTLPKAFADPAHGRMIGTSIAPEGIDATPWIWDLAGELNWRPEPVDWRAWGAGYLRKRYGAAPPELRQAWVRMMEAVGSSPVDQMPHSTILCARPSLDANLRAREWGTTQFRYPPEALLGAWQALLGAAEAAGASDAYLYDVVDLGRQVLGDYARVLHGRIVAAAKEKDAAALRAAGGELLALADDLDALLATRREFLLGRWLAAARRWGATDAERAGAEWNARLLVTTWGDSASNLNDYSAREWSGLMRTFYKHRWAMFLDDLAQALVQGRPFDEGASRRRIAEWEKTWTRQTDGTSYAAVPQGDARHIARALCAKYGPRIVPPKP